MPREVNEGPVVDDKAIRVFPDHRGLHAVVENLARYAADRLERGNVAAQNGLQVLVNDEPRPDQARIAEHHGEQPDDPRYPGLVGELNLRTGPDRTGPARPAGSRTAPRKGRWVEA